MRILILGDINSSHVLKWIHALPKNGFQVALFTLSVPEPVLLNQLKNIEIFVASNADSKSFYSSDFSKLKYLNSLKKIRQIIKDWKPDIVHAHYATSYGLLGVLSNPTKLFISVWGSDVFEFPLKSYFHKKTLSFILNHADEVFATSEILASKTEALTKTNVIVIPFGIDTSLFFPIQKIVSDDVVIGTVKSLEIVYGIDILIKAFSEILKLYPANRILLKIVGTGSQELILKKLVANFNLNGKVEFTGKVAFDKLPDYYRGFDIFANLSRSESFGVSVLEAMSTSVPVVVTATGGLNEIVDEKCGIHVPVEDVGQTVAALKLLIDQRANAIQMGEAGRKRVLSKYNWNDCVQKMIYYYRNAKFN